MDPPSPSYRPPPAKIRCLSYPPCSHTRSPSPRSSSKPSPPNSAAPAAKSPPASSEQAASWYCPQTPPRHTRPRSSASRPQRSAYSASSAQTPDPSCDPERDSPSHHSAAQSSHANPPASRHYPREPPSSRRPVQNPSSLPAPAPPPTRSTFPTPPLSLSSGKSSSSPPHGRAKYTPAPKPLNIPAPAFLQQIFARLKTVSEVRRLPRAIAGFYLSD